MGVFVTHFFDNRFPYKIYPNIYSPKILYKRKNLSMSNGYFISITHIPECVRRIWSLLPSKIPVL